jgi:ferrochelatase
MVDIAVLLMAYGTPHSDDEIEAYLTDIMRGRKPSPEAVEDLKARYRKIGGRSPLLDITNAQASALEEKLKSFDAKTRVYVGMKHWHPYIDEVVPKILNEGPRRIIALVLAPHYSHISIGGYKKALDKALESSQNVRVDFVESWYDCPLFHQAVAEKIAAGLKQFLNPTKRQVIFTAHSLPERILKQNDPYPEQLRLTCEAVAKLSKVDHWTFAYQSASITGEKWLGPDLLEVLGELSRHGDHEVLIVPIGFVADHLEILYDIDVEAQLFASANGLALKRTESLNTSSTFIAALADIVRKRI